MFNLFKREDVVKNEYKRVLYSDLTINEQLEFEVFIDAIPGLRKAMYGSNDDYIGIRDLFASDAALSAFVHAHESGAEYKAYSDTVFLWDFSKSLTGPEYVIHGFTVIGNRVYNINVLSHFLKDFL